MAGYTKLFTDMLDSTVWQLSKEARLLFITMLLKKDRNQVVKAPLPGLAHIARLSLDETKAAMEELTRPDEWSQSKEHGGRRILQVKEGWLVVNGAKYRDKMSVEERREYKRIWQQEYRAKLAEKQSPNLIAIPPGSCLAAEFKKRSRRDEVNKAGEAALTKKGEPIASKTFADEYDLHDAGDLEQPEKEMLTVETVPPLFAVWLKNEAGWTCIKADEPLSWMKTMSREEAETAIKGKELKFQWSPVQ